MDLFPLMIPFETSHCKTKFEKHAYRKKELRKGVVCSRIKMNPGSIYLRVMAFSGQISWQQKQTMQV